MDDGEQAEQREGKESGMREFVESIIVDQRIRPWLSSPDSSTAGCGPTIGSNWTRSQQKPAQARSKCS